MASIKSCLTTPGAALERLAQAPGRPREITVYAKEYDPRRPADGIPIKVRSTIEYYYGIEIVYIPDRGKAAMR